MRNSINQEILIITGDSRPPPRPVERGMREATIRNMVEAVSTDVVKDSIEQFMHQAQLMLSSADSKIGDFNVSQVEISAQISAQGQIMLVGTGANLGAEASLKFVLRRRDS